MYSLNILKIVWNKLSKKSVFYYPNELHCNIKHCIFKIQFLALSRFNSCIDYMVYRYNPLKKSFLQLSSCLVCHTTDISPSSTFNKSAIQRDWHFQNKYPFIPRTAYSNLSSYPIHSSVRNKINITWTIHFIHYILIYRQLT